MFDNTELKTLGMITAAVQHPLSGMRRRMQFYVTETHKRAILGIDACLEMDLIFVNEDNICAVREEHRSPSRHRHSERGGRTSSLERNRPQPPEALSTSS